MYKLSLMRFNSVQAPGYADRGDGDHARKEDLPTVQERLGITQININDLQLLIYELFLQHI